MSDAELKEFLQERDDALRSLDLGRVIAFHLKHNPDARFSSVGVVEIGMHKARTACLSLTKQERQLSKDWLTERGYRSLDDGDLN